MKLCECGCGSPSPIAKQTDARWGWVKGEPKRFIHNHHRRGIGGARHAAWRGGRGIDAHGYVRIRVAPRTDVREHRFIMEQHLGRPLASDEHVHHIDHNRSNNALENLQVLSASDHARLHSG
jgi:HNH endonuclease